MYLWGGERRGSKSKTVPWLCNYTQHWPTCCIGGVLLRQGLAFVGWLHYLWSLYFWPPVLALGCIRAGRTLIHAWKPECLNSSYLFKHFCFLWMMNTPWTQLLLQTRLPMCSLLSLWLKIWRNPWRRNLCCLQGTVPIGAKCLGIDIINYKMLKTLWEPGILDVVRAWARFTLFHLFIDWSGLVGCFGLVFFWGVCCCLLCVVGSWPFLLIGLSNNDNLAQLHDCYGCNDERSIVQKKIDRVLAGCCWEVYATRADPEESLSSLCQVSKCLTMMLAIYLAKEVAAILREILTHPTKRLHDDRTAHLLYSNYWVQPIYQELLHSLSRYNATRTGERNRPDPAMVWPVSPHTLGHPRNWNHLLLKFSLV